MKKRSPRGKQVYMTYAEYEALAELIDMAATALSASDEDFARSMDEVMENAGKLFQKFRNR